MDVTVESGASETGGIGLKTVLVTGGAGFLGSHLVRRLSEDGWKVTVLDNLSTQVHGNVEEEEVQARLGSDVTFIKGDVCDEEAWKEALREQCAVVHLAAETGTGQSMYMISRYTRVNLCGTSILLDLLVQGMHDVERLVVASSRAVYGEGKYSCVQHGEVFPGSRREEDLERGAFAPRCPYCGEAVTPLATDEDSRLDPISIYAVTKLAQEQYVLTVASGIGIPAVALRYQNIFGPGQSLRNPYTGILSIFSTAMLHNEPISIFEDGMESRDFLYVEDAVEATIRALQRDGLESGAINVGTGQPVKVLDAVQTLAELLAVDADIEITGEYRIGDIRHNFASTDRMKTVLDFEPAWDFRRGVESFTKWVQEQRRGSIENAHYSRSLRELRDLGLLR